MHFLEGYKIVVLLLTFGIKCHFSWPIKFRKYGLATKIACMVKNKTKVTCLPVDLLSSKLKSPAECQSS